MSEKLKTFCVDCADCVLHPEHPQDKNPGMCLGIDPRVNLMTGDQLPDNEYIVAPTAEWARFMEYCINNDHECRRFRLKKHYLDKDLRGGLGACPCHVDHTQKLNGRFMHKTTPVKSNVTCRSCIPIMLKADLAKEKG